MEVSSLIHTIPFDYDRRYELRGEPVATRSGAIRTVWRAFRISTDSPVHEIVKSADPELVAADLEDWLRGIW